MAVTKMNMAWIVVSDLDEAIEYYTQKLGLKLLEKQQDFGWAELSGQDGGHRLGLAQARGEEMPPGTNAVVTMSVDNLEQSKAELTEKGVKFIGEVIEIPGQVKLQTFIDRDGNHFQLVEEL